MLTANDHHKRRLELLNEAIDRAQFFQNEISDWQLCAELKSCRVIAHQLTPSQKYYSETSPALNKLIKATRVIKSPSFTPLDLISCAMTPDCKIQWDRQHKGHKLVGMLDFKTLHAVNYVNGLWPFIQERTFNALITMRINSDQDVEMFACSFDDDSVDRDADGNLLLNCKLLYFHAFRAGSNGEKADCADIELETVVQADPRGNMAMLMPMLQYITPITLDSLVQFTTKNGGVPMMCYCKMFEEGLEVQREDVLSDIHYQLNDQCLQLDFKPCAFNQTVCSVELKLYIETQRWLVWRDQSQAVYIKHDGFSIEVQSYVDGCNTFLILKCSLSSTVNACSLAIQSYKFASGDFTVFEIGQEGGGLLQTQKPAMKPIVNGTENDLDILKLRADNLLELFKRLSSEMVLHLPVGMANGSKVYKQAVKGHPIGHVLGVDTFSIRSSADKDKVPTLTVTDVVAVINSSGARPMWDEIFDDAQVLQQCGDDRKIVYSTTKAVWPTAGRYVVACLQEYWSEAKDECQIVAFSLPKDYESGHFNVPSEKNKRLVEATLDIGVWSVRQVNNMIEIQYLVLTNPNGSIPKFVLEMVSKSFPNCIGSVVKFLKGSGFPPYVIKGQNQVTFWRYSHQQRMLSGDFKSEADFTVFIRIDTTRWLHAGEAALIVTETNFTGFEVDMDSAYSHLVKLCFTAGQHRITIRPTSATSQDRIQVLSGENMAISSAIPNVAQEMVLVKQQNEVVQAVQVGDSAYNELANLMKSGKWTPKPTTSPLVLLTTYEKYHRITAYVDIASPAEVLTFLMQYENDLLNLKGRFISPGAYKICKQSSQYDGAFQVKQLILPQGQLSIRAASSCNIAGVADVSLFWLLTEAPKQQCKVQFMLSESLFALKTITAVIAEFELMIQDLVANSPIAYISYPVEDGCVQNNLHVDCVNRDRVGNVSFDLIAAQSSAEHLNYQVHFVCRQLGNEETLLVDLVADDPKLKQCLVIENEVQETALLKLRINDAQQLKIPAKFRVSITRVVQPRVIVRKKSAIQERNVMLWISLLVAVMGIIKIITG